MAGKKANPLDRYYKDGRPRPREVEEERRRRLGWPMKLGDVPGNIPSGHDVMDKHQIRADFIYQRCPTDERVYKIAREFDWRRFSSVSVNLREDGFYYAYDGVGRVCSSMVLPFISVIPVDVQVGMTLTDESLAFSAMNTTRTRVGAKDIYHADLVSGRDGAPTTRLILREHGFYVPRPGHDSPSGLNPFEAIHAFRYSNHPRDILNFFTNIWPEAGAPTAPVVDGLDMFCREILAIGKSLWDAPVRRKFVGIPLSRILKSMVSLADSYNLTKKKACYNALANIWNKRKYKDSKSRIPLLGA